MFALPICRQELLLVGAAHELRTPLTVARGHLELLQRERDCPALEVALDELDRLARIVARMLLIAELETEPPVRGRIELASLLTDAAAARPRVQLATASRGAVAGDKATLLLALEELIANSLDRSFTDEPIVLASRESEDGVIISVTDHGPGVDEQCADNLFDCFARVERDRGRSSGGAGLGLAIVRAVVRAHHGRCGVRHRRSRPGAIWWLWLPVGDDNA
ncbi:MAG: HAMP domain-containing histidine kinase [Acidobacteriota bacterium]|nr:HAMP domain-containing histidine kinase [Acidobacteriota bacterium]